MDVEDEHRLLFSLQCHKYRNSACILGLDFLLLILSHVDVRWPITPETIVFSCFLYQSLWVPLLYLVEWGGWFQISYKRNYT